MNCPADTLLADILAACEVARSRGMHIRSDLTWYTGGYEHPSSINPLGALSHYLGMSSTQIKIQYSLSKGWVSAFCDGYMNRTPRMNYAPHEKEARAMGEIVCQRYPPS